MESSNGGRRSADDHGQGAITPVAPFALALPAGRIRLVFQAAGSGGVIVEDQREVLKFLSRPGAYGAGNAAVDRIDTHVSTVFLVDERAYKLKRAVVFPYLDFSTAERRRHACQAEVRINRRTAPDIYKGVAAVVRMPGGGLKLVSEIEASSDATGTPVDWVVAMTRFDEDTLFDRLAATGKLDRFAMEDVADAIARFHAAAEIRPEGGGASLIASVIESNAGCFAEPATSFLGADRVASITAESRRALAEAAETLDARRRDGQVRHCHGDLHLRNIFLFNGQATLFDGIEFNPEFANIDVLYDLAFLVMDLDHRDLRRFASIVLNRYLDATGDAAGLAAMPLFMAVRAAIRSHVVAFAAAEQTESEAADLARKEARDYLDRALAYLDRSQPRLVAIGGLSGTGKSRLARDMAPHFNTAAGARIVRTDSTRKRVAGVPLATRLGSGGYEPEMTEKTYEAVFDECRAVLAAGQPVIADAVFAAPSERAAIEKLAEDMDAPFHGLWLEAPPEVMQERVMRRRRNVSDATPWVVKLQLQYDLGDVAWSRIVTTGAREETLDKALGLAGVER